MHPLSVSAFTPSNGGKATPFPHAVLLHIHAAGTPEGSPQSAPEYHLHSSQHTTQLALQHLHMVSKSTPDGHPACTVALSTQSAILHHVYNRLCYTLHMVLSCTPHIPPASLHHLHTQHSLFIHSAHSSRPMIDPVPLHDAPFSTLTISALSSTSTQFLWPTLHHHAYTPLFQPQNQCSNRIHAVCASTSGSTQALLHRAPAPIARTQYSCTILHSDYPYIITL